jgi:hypothetical protein
MTTCSFRFSFSTIDVLIITLLAMIGAFPRLYSQENENNDESKPLLSVSVGSQYYSRFTRYGVDLSEDRSDFSFGSKVSQECGLNAGFDVFTVAGANGGYDHSAFQLGYEYSLNPKIKFMGAYTYYSYATDTMSVLAGIANEVVLGGAFEVDSIHFSVSYTTLFGGGTANFIATNASTIYELGRIILEPSIQLCFASQTVNESLLPKNWGQAKKINNGTISSPTVTITGLSNFSISLAFRYALGNIFTVSVVPSYVYSPTDLAISANQFILTIVLVHSLDF